MTPKTNKLPQIVSWKAPNKAEHDRSPAWYVSFAVITLALILYAIFIDHSIITVITFILISFVVFLFAHQPTKNITYKITSTGIVISRTEFPYKVIKKFWIIYRADVKTLNFETTAYLNNRISCELGDQNPIEVKQVLEQYIPEDLEREESTKERLARKLKI